MNQASQRLPVSRGPYQLHAEVIPGTGVPVVLMHGIWGTRPDLREAFLTGYGRQLSTTDRAMLHGCAVLMATWLLVKARETRQRSLEDATHAALLRLLPPANRHRRVQH
jgi:hypothetical protein